jgi:hypothetical protein
MELSDRSSMPGDPLLKEGMPVPEPKRMSSAKFSTPKERLIID